MWYMSRFIVLDYVTSSTRLVFYRTEGVESDTYEVSGPDT